jgi:hypothetical protein
MSRIVGHYAPFMIVTLIGALIVLTLVPALSAYIAWQVLLSIQLGVIFLAISIFAHNRRLCARCIASVPLDAANVAARYTLRFRVAHVFDRRAWAAGYLAIVLVAAFGSTHPVGRYGWAVVQASLAYLLLVYVTHQRLQPWCPHCRNGGEELTVPTTPTPVSSNL